MVLRYACGERKALMLSWPDRRDPTISCAPAAAKLVVAKILLPV
jgi:hypothetical protein